MASGAQGQLIIALTSGNQYKFDPVVVIFRIHVYTCHVHVPLVYCEPSDPR